MVPCLHLRVYQEALTAKPVVFLAIHPATFLRALLQGYATRTESGLGTRTRFVEVSSTFYKNLPVFILQLFISIVSEVKKLMFVKRL